MKCAKCGKNRQSKYMVEVPNHRVEERQFWCRPCIGRLELTKRPANTSQFPPRMEDIMQGEIR